MGRKTDSQFVDITQDEITQLKPRMRRFNSRGSMHVIRGCCDLFPVEAFHMVLDDVLDFPVTDGAAE